MGEGARLLTDVLDMPLLMARIRVAEAHREPVVAFEPQEQVVQTDLVPDPPSHSAGVVEDDPPRHPADVTEDVPEPLADALGRLPAERKPPLLWGKLRQRYLIVRLRPPSTTSASPKSAWASPGGQTSSR